MKIRKVNVLYSLKTKKGTIPKGIYSVDAPKGIPEVVMNEAILGRGTVKVLEYEKAPKEPTYVSDEAQKSPEVTTIDDGSGSVNTQEVKEPEAENEPATAKKKATKKSTKKTTKTDTESKPKTTKKITKRTREKTTSEEDKE